MIGVVTEHADGNQDNDEPEGDQEYLHHNSFARGRAGIGPRALPFKIRATFWRVAIAAAP